MSKGNKNSTVKNLIMLLAVLLLIVLAVGLVVKFTNIKDKLPDDITDIVSPTLRVEYDGTTYTGAENKIGLPESGQMLFKVKYGGNYTVEVLPNVTAANDFTFTTGGKTYPFSGENFTSLFIGKAVYTDYFVIDCTESFLLADTLSRVFGGAEITLNGTMDYPYMLVVTADNGNTVSIAMGQVKAATGVQVNQNSIVF